MGHATRSGSTWIRSTLVGVTLLLSAVVAPFAISAADPVDREWTRQRGDRISVFSGDIEIPAGVEQLGSVVCIGGDLTVNGRVAHDVTVVFGSMTVNGEIGGDATAVLSEVSLQKTRVWGDLVSVVGSLELEASRIDGDVISVIGPLKRDSLSRAGGEFIKVGSTFWTPHLRTILFWLRLVLLFIAFAGLVSVVLVAPERIRLMASEAAPRYLMAFLVGLLGYLGLLVLLTLLSFTVIGVPILLLAFFVIKWMGVAAIFCAIGRRAGRSFGVDLSPLGAVLVIFSLYAALTALPLLLGPFGLIFNVVFAVPFWLLVKVPAVGLVLITRFGSRTGADATVIPVAPGPATPPEEPSSS